MVVVLETSGKNDDVDNVKVKICANHQEAEEYCKEHTDDPMEENYWKYCKIINPNHTYEVGRYRIE